MWVGEPRRLASQCVATGAGRGCCNQPPSSARKPRLPVKPDRRNDFGRSATPPCAERGISAQRRTCPGSPSASTSKGRGGKVAATLTERPSRCGPCFLPASVWKLPRNRQSSGLAASWLPLPPLRLFLQVVQTRMSVEFFFSIFSPFSSSSRAAFGGWREPQRLCCWFSRFTHESSRPPESSREVERVRARPRCAHASLRSGSRHGTRLLR